MESIKQKAINHLRIAIRNDHEHLPSILSLCEILIDTESYDEAQKILNTALKRSSEKSVLYYQQAKLSFKILNYEKAISYVDKAISIEPNNPASYQLAQEILFANNKQHLAIPYLEKLTDLNPLDGRAYFTLAQLLNEGDEWKRKKILLEISIELLPDNVAPKVDLALLIMQINSEIIDENYDDKPNLDEAEKLFESVIETQPTFGIPWFFLGKLNLLKKKSRTAKKKFEEAHKYTETKGKSAYQLGLLSLQYNNTKKAEEYFYESIKFNVRKSDCLYNISKIQTSKKEFNKSLKLLNDALQEVREEENYKYEKSKKYTESLNFKLARKYLKEAFTKKELQSKIIIKICQANKFLQKKQNIEDLLTKAIHLSPSYFEPYFELGLHLVQEKRIDEAKLKLNLACNCKWDHLESHFELGKLELKTENIAEATMHFEIVLDLNNSHQSALKLLNEIRS